MAAVFENAAQIMQAINEVANDDAPLYERMESDFNLFRGEQYQARKGDQAFTSNEPQTLADKVIDIIAKADLDLKIPIFTEPEDDRREISNTERFVSGCLDYADLRLKRRGEPTLQPLAAWHAVVRGWIVGRPLVYKSEAAGGDTVVQIDLWDRRWVRYEMGSEGILWVAFIRNVPIRVAQQEFGLDLDKNWKQFSTTASYTGSSGTKATIQVIDFFDEKNNAIILSPSQGTTNTTGAKDGWYWKEPTPHNCDGPPVIIRPCGATPLVASDDHTDTIKDQGESIYANNRNMYAPYNKLWSNILTMTDKGARGAYKVMSRDGHLTMTTDPAKEGSNPSLSTDKKQDLVPLETFTMPKDTPAMMSALGKSIQVGGTSDVMHGVLSQSPLSGLAIQQLRQAVATLVDRRALTVQEFFEDCAWHLTTQFAKGGLKPIELNVKRDTKFTELIKFHPRSYGERPAVRQYRFKALLKPDMPQDDMQKYMMAQAARQPDQDGQPLLSDGTIMEHIIKLPDTDLEDDKKIMEWFYKQTVFRLRRIESALINQQADQDVIDVAHAMRLQAENEFIRSMTLGGGGGGQGGQPQPQQPPMLGTIGVQGAPGVPPGVMPPEQMNPAMMQQMQDPAMQQAMAMAQMQQGGGGI